MYNYLNKDNYIVALDHSKGLIKENFFSLDLTRKQDVDIFVKESTKFDALIFLVGLAHKKGKTNDYEEFDKINKQTLVNLLSALNVAGKSPRKIIFSSTISVYGEKINKSIYSEEASVEPFSPYAVTKLDVEKYLIKNYINESWILRFAPVYAQNFQLNINRRTKLFGSFYKVGKGEKKLSLCNLKNIGLTIKGILEDKIPAGVYNVSDAKDYSYNDLLKYVNAKWKFPIPNLIVNGILLFGEMINSIFLKENAIKLISNNIFPSEKIRQYIKFPHILDD